MKRLIASTDVVAFCTNVLYLVLIGLASGASTIGCEPDVPDSPSKEQAVKFVQDRVGYGTVLWYVPFEPEKQSYGSSSEPARSLVLYRRDEYCFLLDLHGTHRFLVPCDTQVPKTAVKP